MRVHGVEVVGVGHDDTRAAVVEDVGEVVGGQPVVDGHEHRADLRDGVEGFELGVGVGGDGGDAVPLATPICCSAAEARSQRSKNCS